MRRAALVVLALLVVAAVGVVWRSHGDYARQDREHIAAEASREHWTGTDELGRDRAVRVAGALLLGITGAVFAAGLATCVALAVGCLAAFCGRAVAVCLLYVSDLFLTLPWLFLLMMVRSTLPLTMAPVKSAAITFLLLGLLGWPVFARVAYTGARGIRGADFMVQGRASGLRAGQIARSYVLPHLLPLALTQFLISVPACLVAEANLGALGLGVSEPLPSWGSMLLTLQNSAALAGSHWIYLPIVLLVGVLVLLEMLVREAS